MTTVSPADEKPKNEAGGPEDNEAPLEVEVLDAAQVTTTPPADAAAQPPPTEGAPAEKPLGDEPDEEELKSYSERVQERIKKLSAQRHYERRAKEELRRQNDELVKISKGALEEVNKFKTLIHQGEGVWKETNKGRLEAEIDRARNDYKNAYEAGDADKIADAQSKLTRLNVELEHTNSWQPQPLPPSEMPQQAPQEPKRDEQAEDWQTKNKWFGQDVEMTAYALGVHQRLVNEGIDPTSDAYYKQIDASLEKRFADKLGRPSAAPSGQSNGTGASVVAPANRSSKAPRKITLTPTQVALAKKFGLTTTQYAEEVLKLGQS